MSQGYPVFVSQNYKLAEDFEPVPTCQGTSYNDSVADDWILGVDGKISCKNHILRK